jgi:hypothetical protein
VAIFSDVQRTRNGGRTAIGTFEISEYAVRGEVVRELQWRWMKASSMKEVVKIDANKRQAMRRTFPVDSIIYNCMESLSEQSGAERRHFVRCKLVRPEVFSKKKKKLGSGCREISLEECDERR